MSAALHLVSTLAVGFIAAALIAVGASDYLPFERTGTGLANLDYGSLGLGLILGALISNIARVGWSEIPRRLAAWLISQRGTFQLMGLGALCAAVLLLY